MVGFIYHGFANSGLNTADRLALVPGSATFALHVGGSKVQLGGWNIYTLLLWTLKMCMCVFYSRLTYVSGWVAYLVVTNC